MKKKILFVIVVSFSTMFIGCKTDAEKHAECVAMGEKLVTAWMNDSVSDEDLSFIRNYFDLIEEYGTPVPYKEYNHVAGMKSDTTGFMNQISKDSKLISVAETRERYEGFNDTVLDSTRIWFADNKPYLHDDEIRAKQLLSLDTMIAVFTSDKYIDEGMSVSEYKEIVEKDLSYYYSFKNKGLSYFKEQKKYLVFIHTEYVYPPLMINNSSYEGGVLCAKLKIFRVSDKVCLLDKRILVTSSSRAVSYDMTVDRGRGRKETWHVNSFNGDLKERLSYEVVLQGSQIGMPLRGRDPVLDH